MDEAVLVGRCQRGDVAAFEALFRLYYPRVMQAAYLITGDIRLAEDVTQEAFTQTFRQMGQLRVPRAFSSWMYRIAVRQSRRVSTIERKERILPFKVTPAEPAGQPELGELTADQLLVWGAMERLPEPQRIAVILHYFHDMPLSDVGRIMDAPEGTVKSWLYRAKSSLAKELAGTLAGGGGR